MCFNIRLVRCNLIDEIRIKRTSFWTQRLESIFNLIEERSSAIILPNMADSLDNLGADFEELRKICIEMTDFVFPSLDYQMEMAKV